jgi:hypothetical protein
MRKLFLPAMIVLGGILLVAAIVALSLRGAQQSAPNSPSAGDGAPILQVDKQIIDFGDVKLGEWVTASFLVTNAGSQPLSFSQPPFIEVRAGC